jgi:GR25 family glycosyltransferase involved in LPS biosynthesis
MQQLHVIDRVYVVNLASRQDRRQVWEQLAEKLPLLKSKIEFYTAVDGSKLTNRTKLRNGELGCSMSHAGIWRDALAKGYRFILVFEDDVLFDELFETKLNSLLEELKEDFDWLYLYNTWDFRPVEPHSANLNKVIASLGTQAYVFNTRATGRVLPYVEEFIFPIDVVMGHMAFLSRVYRPKDIFVLHNEDSASDIAGISEKMGVIQRIKKMLKFSQS